MKPISRRDLIRRLRLLGFEGPYVGGSHPHMRRGSLRLTIPNEHTGDIGVPLLRLILKKAGFEEEEWNSLGE